MIYPNVKVRQRHIYLVNGQIPCRITEMIRSNKSIKKWCELCKFNAVRQKRKSNFQGTACVWLHYVVDAILKYL